MANLNSGQFNSAFDIGAQQRRKKERRGLAGAYVGLGNNWKNYPYVYGTMGTGGSLTASYEQDKKPNKKTARQSVAEAMGTRTNGVVTTGVPSITSNGNGAGGTLTGLSGTSG